MAYVSTLVLVIVLSDVNLGVRLSINKKKTSREVYVFLMYSQLEFLDVFHHISI